MSHTLPGPVPLAPAAPPLFLRFGTSTTARFPVAPGGGSGTISHLAAGRSAGVTLGTLTLWLLVETIKVRKDRARPFLAICGMRVIGWRERIYVGAHYPRGVIGGAVLG